MKPVSDAFRPGMGDLSHVLKVRASEVLQSAIQRCNKELRDKVAEGSAVIAANSKVKRLMNSNNKIWNALGGDPNYLVDAKFCYSMLSKHQPVSSMCYVSGHYGGSADVWHLLTKAERNKLKKIQAEAQVIQEKDLSLNGKLDRIESTNAASLYLDGMNAAALKKLDEVIKLLPKLTSKLLD